VTTKPLVVRHHVRLRECPPGAVVASLADLDNDNVAAIYMLRYVGPVGGGGTPISRDAAAVISTPAEASGLDLPVGGVSSFGASGGGSADYTGLPPGLGGGSSTGGFGGGLPSSASGGGGVASPVIAPPGGTTEPSGGSLPSGGPGGGVTGVPEPTTWTLMLIGIAGLGATLRLARPGTRID
jgi:hypothetical protein